jgi:hypothetical protein
VVSPGDDVGANREGNEKRGIVAATVAITVPEAAVPKTTKTVIGVIGVVGVGVGVGVCAQTGTEGTATAAVAVATAA